MHAITGITGKAGGELAHNLLAGGQRVRAIVRNASKGEAWATRGCEVALPKMEDGLALADAFAGATAIFIMDFNPRIATGIPPSVEPQKRKLCCSPR
jgi:NAD(P)H dehydrogenase (quinone)